MNTEALQVLKVREEDEARIYRITGDARCMQFITGRPLTRSENRDQVRKLVRQFAQREQQGLWTVWFGKPPEFVGLGALMPLEDAIAEIGFRVVPGRWGHGLGTAIAQWLVRKARQASFQRLVAYVDQRNAPSMHILEKLNFMEVGSEEDDHGSFTLIYHLSLAPEPTFSTT